MGRVYWITGLSGAGKTTIGKLLCDELRKQKDKVIFLDGDTMRTVFADDLGYSEEDRRKCAMRYSRLCKMLAEQDFDVICCTISMYHAVREWNRSNIEDYFEIYVKVPWEILCARNQKNLYCEVQQKKRIDVVGACGNIEEPVNPDMVILNSGSVGLDEIVKEIIVKSI